jgi:hypothetical protein
MLSLISPDIEETFSVRFAHMGRYRANHCRRFHRDPASQPWHHAFMSQDDQTLPIVPEVSSLDENLPPLSPEALAAFENLVPLLVEPETLIQGLRFLQKRIPGFVHLSIQEERSMARTAYLPAKAVDIGIDSAGVVLSAKAVSGMTSEEMRQARDLSRRWESASRELGVLKKGIDGANLVRKHRLGLATLDLYAFMQRAKKKHTQYRPYVEDMRRAFAEVRKKKPRKE